MKHIDKLSVKEKSLMLAELVGWEIRNNKEYAELGLNDKYIIDCEGGLILEGMPLVPYKNSRNGLAQSYTIFLKFPEVMERFWREADQCGRWVLVEPNQGSVLDEILIMNELAVR